MHFLVSIFISCSLCMTLGACTPPLNNESDSFLPHEIKIANHSLSSIITVVSISSVTARTTSSAPMAIPNTKRNSQDAFKDYAYYP